MEIDKLNCGILLAISEGTNVLCPNESGNDPIEIDLRRNKKSPVDFMRIENSESPIFENAGRPERKDFSL